MAPDQDVTCYLQELVAGDRSAVDRLLPHVYGDLRALASNLFAGQRRDHTLQPTALVNEAYMRLIGSGQSMENRRHFLCVAAIAMRQLLSDHARRRDTEKRGGTHNRVPLADAPYVDGEGMDLEALNTALESLEEVDTRQAKIVEMRFFAGMTYVEIGEVLGIAARTARLDWKMAQGWLNNEISRLEGEDSK